MDLKNIIFKNKEAFLEFAKQKSDSLSYSNDYQLLVAEKKRNEDALSKIENYTKKAYEQFIDGILLETTYLTLMNKYKKELSVFRNRKLWWIHTICIHFLFIQIHNEIIHFVYFGCNI